MKFYTNVQMYGNTILLRGPKSRAALAHFGHRTTVNNEHTHDGVKPCGGEGVRARALHVIAVAQPREEEGGGQPDVTTEKARDRK